MTESEERKLLREWMDWWDGNKDPDDYPPVTSTRTILTQSKRDQPNAAGQAQVAGTADNSVGTQMPVSAAPCSEKNDATALPEIIGPTTKIVEEVTARLGDLEGTESMEEVVAAVLRAYATTLPSASQQSDTAKVLREAFAWGLDLRHKKDCPLPASNFQKGQPCKCGRDALKSRLNELAFGVVDGRNKK